MKTCVSALPLWVLLFVSSMIAPKSRGQNLIQNGGFENSFSGWSGTYGIYNRPINPAPLSGTAVGMVLSAQNPMLQLFTTVPGATYTVSWGRRLPDLIAPGVPSIGEPSDAGVLELNINGNDTGDFVDNRNSWEVKTLDFIATSNTSQLSFFVPEYIFISPDTFEKSASIFVDNISVTRAPEPQTGAFLLLGLFPCAVREARKARNRQQTAK